MGMVVGSAKKIRCSYVLSIIGHDVQSDLDLLNYASGFSTPSWAPDAFGSAGKLLLSSGNSRESRHSGRIARSLHCALGCHKDSSRNSAAEKFQVLDALSPGSLVARGIFRAWYVLLLVLSTTKDHTRRERRIDRGGLVAR